MLKKPWFRIIGVYEGGKRSMADIAAEVARDRGIGLHEMRGEAKPGYVVDARFEAYRRIRQERPNLSSSQVAAYFNKEPSSIRHAWRRQHAMENAS